jgi:succinate dehydrogenase hydrophobic anchor subunit
MMKISLKTIGLTLRTSQLYRMLVYALVTAIIEVPSIIVLYSLGYPNNPHATASTAFRIAYNIFFWLLVLGRSYPGADPGSLISNPLFQLFAGVVCMFIIVTLIGEAIVWLNGEISKLSREISNWRSGK